MTSSPSGLARRRVFLAAVILSASLLAIPIPLAGALRGVVHAVLKPGMVVTNLPVAAVSDVVHTWQSARMTRTQADRLRSEIQRLKNRLGESQARAADFRRQLEQSAAWRRLAPRFQYRLVPANVIGRQASVLLGGMGILSIGRDRGAAAQSLVIDVGADDGLGPEAPVLGGKGVVGKVQQVGPHTCLLRVLTDPGFMERAEVHRLTSSGESVVVAKGLLAGTGDGTCRLTDVSLQFETRGQVTVKYQVSEGDVVMTTGYQPVLPHALVFGRVVEVRRKPADLDWTIVVEPAVKLERLRRVYVVTAELSGGLAQAR